MRQPRVMASALEAEERQGRLKAQPYHHLDQVHCLGSFYHNRQKSVTKNRCKWRQIKKSFLSINNNEELDKRFLLLSVISFEGVHALRKNFPGPERSFSAL